MAKTVDNPGKVTFVTSTKRFLKAADWLDDTHAPVKFALIKSAEALDKKLNPPLLAQYRLFYKQLLEAKPAEIVIEDDPLEALLKAHGK